MIGEEKGSVAISGRSSHKMTGLLAYIEEKRYKITHAQRQQTITYAHFFQGLGEHVRSLRRTKKELIS